MHIQNGILLSHEINVSFSDVDRPRDCHTKRSNTEKEKKNHILTNIFELLKMA